MPRMSSSKLRTDPSSSTELAITFSALLSVLKVPAVRTTRFRGSIDRDTIRFKLTSIWAATKVVSTAKWGIAACPPLPVSIILKRSADAINGPFLMANFPV